MQRCRIVFGLVVVCVVAGQDACPGDLARDTHLVHWLQFDNASAPRHDTITNASLGYFQAGGGDAAECPGALAPRGIIGSAYVTDPTRACTVFYVPHKATNLTRQTLSFFYSPAGVNDSYFSVYGGLVYGDSNSTVAFYNASAARQDRIALETPRRHAWVHVAAALDFAHACGEDGHLSLYIDGVLRARGVIGSYADRVCGAAATSLVFGAENGSAFSGAMFDDLRIYERVLSERNVAQLAAQRQNSTRLCVCPLGTAEKHNDTCEACPMGTYGSLGASACLGCPSNTTTVAAGSTERSLCVPARGYVRTASSTTTTTTSASSTTTTTASASASSTTTTTASASASNTTTTTASASASNTTTTTASGTTTTTASASGTTTSTTTPSAPVSTPIPTLLAESFTLGKKTPDDDEAKVPDGGVTLSLVAGIALGAGGTLLVCILYIHGHGGVLKRDVYFGIP